MLVAHPRFNVNYRDYDDDDDQRRQRENSSNTNWIAKKNNTNGRKSRVKTMLKTMSIEEQKKKSHKFINNLLKHDIWKQPQQKL